MDDALARAGSEVNDSGKENAILEDSLNNGFPVDDSEEVDPTLCGSVRGMVLSDDSDVDDSLPATPLEDRLVVDV